VSASQPPSEKFWDSVIDSGSIVITCGFCDRTHFVSDGAYDEGELEELREKAEKYPDKYIENAMADSIRWGYIGGKQAVYECPCNEARKYEDFIWAHRHLIVKYLRGRTDAQLAEAKRDAKEIRKLKDV
jgi:hypothetical protein